MSEELGQEDQKEVEKQSPEVSPVEQQAMEQGWVPKEEFQGDEHKWVEAAEFLRRGELFSKIDSQNREVKDLRKALHNLQEHYTKVKETEYNRALSALKQQYKSANREQDFERADLLEAEIEAVEQEAKTFKEEVSQVQKEAEQIHPEFAAWVQKNSWYSSQKHMRLFADEEGVKFRQLGMEPKEVLKKVEEAVRKEFPSKFTNPNRERPGAVEGTSNRGSAKQDSFELTDQETRIMQSLISQKDKNGKPLMTKAEYIADLKRVKGIKE